MPAGSIELLQGLEQNLGVLIEICNNLNINLSFHLYILCNCCINSKLAIDFTNLSLEHLFSFHSYLNLTQMAWIVGLQCDYMYDVKILSVSL